jgi:hypothetical protein
MRRSTRLLRSEVIDLIRIHNLVDWRTGNPEHMKEDLVAGFGAPPDARER